MLVPGFGVSTSEAWANDAERDLARGPILREPQHVPGPWPSRSAQMINDLEVPIARHHPEIDQMAALRRAGGGRDVGQRVGRLWPVPEAERRAGRRKSPRRFRVARSPHRIARPRGIRAAQPAATIDDRGLMT